APNNVAAFVRTSANALMRDPPQFYVSRDHVPREVRIHLATQTILTGGQSLEFSHLSLGEYLAASSLGDLAAERAALAGDSFWRSNHAILPLAHAMSSEALSAALADAQTRDPDPALLKLLLRAVAYGGAEVTDFCRASADAVVTETARRLSLGNARFGDRERGLMRAFERAAGAFVGSRVPDGLPTLGEPGAEAWHLRMALEPTWNERPAE